MFIIRGEPHDSNLPASPDVPSVYVRTGWQGAAVAAPLIADGTATAVLSVQGDENLS